MISKKGVSEIIVVTMVIVVSIIIAGIFFVWINEYLSKDKLDQTGGVLLQASDLSCMNVKIKVDSCTINNANKVTQILVTNSSDLTLFNFVLTIEGKNVSGTDMTLIGTFDESVSGGQIVNLSTDTNFNYTREDFDYFTLDTSEITSMVLTNGTCPKKSEILECEIIAGPLTTRIISPEDEKYYFYEDSIDFNAYTSGGSEDYNCSWSSDVDGELDTGCNLAIDTLKNLGAHTITLTVTDGESTEIATTGITIKDHLVPIISSPADESIVALGAIEFSGSVSNAQGEYTCSWTSDVDGAIGSRCDFNKSNLTLGVHTITLTVADELETRSTTADINVLAE
ncbi:MAG: hypothetical protein WCX82_00225 [archaeon]|jgi:hypothetical protein